MSSALWWTQASRIRAEVERRTSHLIGYEAKKLARKVARRLDEAPVADTKVAERVLIREKALLAAVAETIADPRQISADEVNAAIELAVAFVEADVRPAPSARPSTRRRRCIGSRGSNAEAVP